MDTVENTQPPTLDTGWFKSGWTHFWILPFAILSWVGFALVSSALIQGGLSDRWGYQVAGIILLLGFAIVLSWIYVRGLSRERVWIGEEVIRIRRKGILSNDEATFPFAEVRGIEFSMAAEVGDISLRTSDGKAVPVAVSLPTRKLESWAQCLSTIAPCRRLG